MDNTDAKHKRFMRIYENGFARYFIHRCCYMWSALNQVPHFIEDLEQDAYQFIWKHCCDKDYRICSILKHVRSFIINQAAEEYGKRERITKRRPIHEGENAYRVNAILVEYNDDYTEGHRYSNDLKEVAVSRITEDFFHSKLLTIRHGELAYDCIMEDYSTRMAMDKYKITSSDAAQKYKRRALDKLKRYKNPLTDK